MKRCFSTASRIRKVPLSPLNPPFKLSASQENDETTVHTLQYYTSAPLKGFNTVAKLRWSSNFVSLIRGSVLSKPSFVADMTLKKESSNVKHSPLELSFTLK